MGICKLIRRHWWTQYGWGTRRCRLCHRHERAMYDVELGIHWVVEGGEVN